MPFYFRVGGVVGLRRVVAFAMRRLLVVAKRVGCLAVYVVVLLLVVAVAVVLKFEYQPREVIELDGPLTVRPRAKIDVKKSIAKNV